MFSMPFHPQNHTARSTINTHHHFVFLFLTIWALFVFQHIDLPTKVPGVWLDDSWKHFSTFAFDNNLQAGKDYIFTSGPLSWLLYDDTFTPELIWIKLLLQFSILSFTAFYLSLLLARFNNLILIVIGVTLILASSWYFTAILTLVVHLFSEGDIALKKKILPLTLLALFSLIRFNLFIVIVLAIAGLIARDLFYRNNIRQAAVTAITFSFFFMLIWILAGQSVFNLSKWIYSSLHITGGYSEAMNIRYRPSTKPDLEIGMALAALFAWWAGLAIQLNQKAVYKDKNLYLVGFFVLFGFIQWKAAFVRHDGHVFFFPISVTIAIYISFLIHNDISARRRLFSNIFKLIGLLLSLSLWIYISGNFKYPIATLVSRMKSQTVKMFHFNETLTSFQNRFRQQQNVNYLPKLHEIVGDATTDLLTQNQQGILILNHWNYRPRPVFQSYSAYTPYLLKQNEAFYKGENAPEYIVMDLGTIDYRFPTLDDGLVLNHILHNYNAVAFEGNYTLFRRGSPSKEEDRVELLDGRFVWGEKINLARFKGKLVYLKADIAYSLVGKIIKLLYKAPEIKLVISKRNSETEYKIVPGMCKTGFLLQPLTSNGFEFMALQNSAAWRETNAIDSFKIEFKRPKDTIYFDRTIRITLEEIPLNISSSYHFIGGYHPIHHTNFNDIVKLKSKMEHLPFGGPMIYEEKNKKGSWSMLVHSYSKGKIELKDDARFISIGYGIRKGAYSGGFTDGVEFKLTLERPDGTTSVIWSRYLDPLNNAADRGLQKKKIALPSFQNSATLIFETLPGGSSAYDWSYVETFAIMDQDGNLLEFTGYSREQI